MRSSLKILILTDNSWPSEQWLSTVGTCQPINTREASMASLNLFTSCANMVVSHHIFFSWEVGGRGAKVGACAHDEVKWGNIWKEDRRRKHVRMSEWECGRASVKAAACAFRCKVGLKKIGFASGGAEVWQRREAQAPAKRTKT